MSQTINEKLGAWLLVNGNSREKLAKEIGISRQALANRLKGRSGWKWCEVVRIAELLDCSFSELV